MKKPFSVEDINDGDSLRNYACWLYLREFTKFPGIIPQNLKSRNSNKTKKFYDLSVKLLQNSANYNPTFQYGDLYSDFLRAFNEILLDPPLIFPKAQSFKEEQEQAKIREKDRQERAKIAKLIFQNKSEV